LEVRIISFIKGPPISVELVGKLPQEWRVSHRLPVAQVHTYDELELLSIVGSLGVCRLGRVWIQKTRSLVLEQADLIGQTVGIGCTGGFGEAIYLARKCPARVSYVSTFVSDRSSQSWVADEQDQYTQGDQCQTPHVGHPSLVPDVALLSIVVVRIWIV